MEKRLGIISIIVSSKENIAIVNQLISDASSIIIARHGMPLRDKNISFISLIVEGTPNEINSITGKLGRFHGVDVNAMFVKQKS